MSDHTVNFTRHLVVDAHGNLLEIEHSSRDDWRATEAARGALVVDADDLAAAYARLAEPELAAEVARRRAAHDVATAVTNGTA